MRDRYSIVVGLLFLAVIVVATIQTLGGGGGEGTLGLDRQPTHWPLPEFAVPVAAGQLEGDANVAQDDCESSARALSRGRPPRLRLPASARRTRSASATSSTARWCSRSGSPKAATAPTSRTSSTRVYARYRGRVNFLSLNVRDDRDTVRDLVREHGWKMPVGYDRDGAVASLYRVGGCPTFAYVYPGGTLAERQHRRPHRRSALRPRRAAAGGDQGRRRACR